MRRDTSANTTDDISEEAARILNERGPVWEYRLFARVLADEISAASDIRREFDRGIAFGPGEYIADDEFGTWAGVRLGEVGRLAKTAGRLVNEELPDALGPEGVPADADEIVFVATQLGRVYREVIAWAGRVRRAQFESDDLDEIVDGLVACGGDIIERLGAWGLSLAPELERAVDDARRGGDGAERREVSFVLRFDHAVIDRLQETMRVVYARRGLDID